MNITKEQFTQWAIDVKGFRQDEVKETLAEIRSCGMPIQDYLSQEDIEECAAYNA